MKTRILLIALIATIKLNASAARLTLTASETRTVDKFSGIELKNSANVIITQGDVQEVKVEAEPNVLSHITTTVTNNQLIISSDKDLKTDAPITVFITVKELSSLELTGSGNMTTKSVFKNDNMVMRLSGSGDINASVDAKSLKLTLSGSGNMNLKGRTSESDISISGSGDVDGKDLHAFKSEINITGSGTSTVDVNNELTVDITGSGSVYYITDPERIHSKILGTGKIEKVKA